MNMDSELLRFWMTFAHLPLHMFLYDNDQFELLPIDQRCKLVLLRSKARPDVALLLGDEAGNWTGGQEIAVSLKRKPGDIFQDHETEKYSIACACCSIHWMNQDIVAEEEKIVAKIFEVSNLNDISCIACAYPAQFIDAQEEAGLSRTITFVNTWEKDEMKKVFPAIVIFDELISLKENGKPLSCLCR